MKRKKRGKRGKIIILGIAVVVLLAAGIFFFCIQGKACKGHGYGPSTSSLHGG